VQADLFLCLARGGRPDGLVALQMTGGDAVLSIAKACVKSTREQDLILTEEEKMNCDRESGTHCEIIQSKDETSGLCNSEV